MLSVQVPEQLKQKTNKKLLQFKRKAFLAEFLVVKRFNFAHFCFPGKFFLSYNTGIIYTQSSLNALVHIPNFQGVSGSEDRGGHDNNVQSLLLGGRVTKVLKNCDEE